MHLSKNHIDLAAERARKYRGKQEEKPDTGTLTVFWQFIFGIIMVISVCAFITLGAYLIVKAAGVILSFLIWIYESIANLF